MKTQITVKYHNGKCAYTKFGGSASQVQQVINIIQPELVSRCGNYRWSLDGDCRKGYSIIATFAGGNFTESTGKTPAQALKNFLTARNILREQYVGEWN